MAETVKYVQRIRTHIGHSPLILIGARVFVEDNAGRILLHRRTDFVDF